MEERVLLIRNIDFYFGNSLAFLTIANLEAIGNLFFISLKKLAKENYTH